MEILKQCPLCGEETKNRFLSDIRGESCHIDCRTCGTFVASRELVEDRTLNKYPDKHLLSGLSRYYNENKLEPINFSNGKLGEIIQDHYAIIPQSPFDKADTLLLVIYNQSVSPGTEVKLVSQFDYPLAFASYAGEFNFYSNYLAESGLLTKHNEHHSLTFLGYKRVDELQNIIPKSDQCFIAMWFDTNLDEVNAAIKAAAKDTGYKGLRVDDIEHSDKIDDRIIAEIRRSGMMVADFTGHRGGVYFEAGYAMGLGIPIIWTCRKDDIENLHFDIRQYNCIAWETPEELRERLVDRINARIQVT